MIKRTPEEVATSRTCPRCGHELLIKSGSYGEFIGCSSYPACRYTSNLDGSKTKFIREATEWDESGKVTEISNHIVPKETKPQVCPLSKCDGSQKTPFVKEGKTIPNTFIFCECSPYSHPYDNDRFRETRPDDIDYPISYSHYQSLSAYHGWPKPPDIQSGTETTPKPLDEPRSAPQPVNLADYQQLKAQVNYVQNKLMEKRADDKKNQGEYY